jgi:hypothetical protein
MYTTKRGRRSDFKAEIPELVAPIMISLIEDAANTGATETSVPFGKREVITSPPLLG